MSYWSKKDRCNEGVQLASTLRSNDQDKYDGYKSNARKEKVKQMKLSLYKQKSFFANINQSNENSVRASFAISEIISKSSRPFTEGMFIKECLLKVSEILCPNQKKLFEGISLSPNTVASRVTNLAANAEKQLLATTKDFEAFSIALDDKHRFVRYGTMCCFYQECGFPTKLSERIPGFYTTKGYCN